jgi:GNAT superfamily N-acetyltransferase
MDVRAAPDRLTSTGLRKGSRLRMSQSSKTDATRIARLRCVVHRSRFAMILSTTTSLSDTLREFAHEPAVTIERVSQRSRWPIVDTLLREYVPWAVQRLELDHGVRFDDVDAEMEQHHAAFAAEAELLLGKRGRLLLAHVDGQPAGLVALKPIDDGTAEVKRMFVRPAMRGHGIGRRLLERLLADARIEGFGTVRLETLGFMTEARALYASLGFVEAAAFRALPPTVPEMAKVILFMNLALQPADRDAMAVAALA